MNISTQRPKNYDAVIGGNGIKPGSAVLGGVGGVARIINRLKSDNVDPKEILDMIDLHPTVRSKIFEFASKMLMRSTNRFPKRGVRWFAKNNSNAVEILGNRKHQQKHLVYLTIAPTANTVSFTWLPILKEDFVELLVSVNFVFIALGHYKSETDLREAMQIAVNTRSIEQILPNTPLTNTFATHHKESTLTMVQNWFTQWDCIREFLVYVLIAKIVD